MARELPSRLEGRQERVPPGQAVTEKFLVLSYGPTPRIDLKRWRFEVFGLVEEPLILTYAEFLALPKVHVVSDVHCVTRWSRLNNHWEGVSFREIMRLVTPKAEVRFALVHCYGGYTADLPLAALLDDDVLLAYRHDGADLTPEHGWPLRLVVPGRYFWKSAKWVRGLELLAQDHPGFWELYGYHPNADPWQEERYAE